MTTVVKPDVKEPRMMPEKPGLISQEDALRPRTFRTKDADIPDRGTMRFRELRQREREAIEEPVLKQETDKDGKITVRRDEVGYRARAIAYAAVKADGSPFFSDPAKAAETINDNWAGPEVEAGFKVVDELNLLTLGAQRAAGKDTGRTAGAGSS